MGYFDVDKQSENAPRSPAAPEPGLGSVPEYVVSSLPWVTASTATTATTLNYQFPKVTRYIQFSNHGTVGQLIRVGFTQNGVEGTNSIKIDGTQTVRLDVRVKEIFVRSDGGASPAFSFLAGLTMIPSKFMPTLTGSVSSPHGSWEGVG